MRRKRIFLIPIIILLIFIGYTISDNLDNDVRVALNSDLIYYLSVKYDGVDVFKVKSDDSTVSEVYSDVINVTDQIPEGLIFNGFIVSSDGTIGAVRRDNESIQCLGSVIDDTNEEENEGRWNDDYTEYTYHGLHYDATNRIVSFKVKNLKAGCVLNVGIKTKTPDTVDDPNTVVVEKRRDFYNHAIVYESVQKAISNVVHVFIGNDDSERYEVRYEIEGDVPSDFIYPPTLSYLKGTMVSIDNNINVLGYTFNGWSSLDVEISDNKFVMPDDNVVIKGSFAKINPYKVTYQINGDIPDKYVVPLLKEYYKDSNVIVDNLSDGDVFNGYKFNGWSSLDVSISNNTFVMPNNDVIITGSFTPLKYKVIYQFQGSVLPENSELLLPSEKEYNEGDNVILDSINDLEGYKFLGWNKEQNFIMPSENVIVYGEWMRINGEFEPGIELAIVDEKDYYRSGDKIKYKLTVTNDEDYSISDVIIKENLDCLFKDIEGYSVFQDIITIDNVDAHSSFDIYYDYIVKDSDNNIVTNEVSLLGALASDYYLLKEKDYKSSIMSNLQSKLKICTTVDGVDVGNSFNIKVNNNDLEYWIKLNNGQCDSLYLNPGNYKIFEIVPQEYTLENVNGAISSNNSNLVINQGNDYQVNFVNKFKRKKFTHIFGEITNTIKGGL